MLWPVPTLFSRLGHTKTRKSSRRPERRGFRPRIERLEDRRLLTLVLTLQEAGVNGGATTIVGTAADFTAASFSGTYGDFQVAILGGASHNGANGSDLLSSATSVKNIGASTAILNVLNQLESLVD